MSEPLRKLNIGCGPYPQSGHINIDVNPNYKPDILRDVRRGLPFDDSSVGHVRTSHFLEHLESEDLIFLIGEIHRVLVHGGDWRIVAPLGVTGDLDHKIVFHEISFDCLLRPETAGYYQIPGMRWEEISRKIVDEPRCHGFRSLILDLRAVKS